MYQRYNGIHGLVLLAKRFDLCHQDLLTLYLDIVIALRVRENGETVDKTLQMWTLAYFGCHFPAILPRVLSDLVIHFGEFNGANAILWAAKRL
jgi:hypothetical protein